MKSLTKSIRAKFAAENTHVQFSLPVAGVLRDGRSAFFGLCFNAGKALLAKMMEAERTTLCGQKAYLIRRARPTAADIPGHRSRALDGR